MNPGQHGPGCNCNNCVQSNVSACINCGSPWHTWKNCKRDEKKKPKKKAP